MLAKVNKQIVARESKILFKDIAALIEKSKANVQKNVNQELTLLNWHIGKHMEETLCGKEETYGMAIVATVSQQLQYT
jgi:hypothetical protein